MASNTLTDPDQADFENQMAYANALRKRSMDTGGEMISGHYVSKNPWLNFIEGLTGSMTGQRALGGQRQLENRRQQEFDTFMGARPSIYNEFEGQVATPEQQFGPTQAPVVKQRALKGAAQMLEDQQNWIARPGGESNPLIQAVRQKAMLNGLDWPEKMLTQEGTLQLGRDKIAADAQNRKDQRDFLAGQGDLNRQSREDMIRLTASLRPPPAAPAPHTSIAYDKEGNGFLVDMRTGAQTPLENVGKVPGGGKQGKGPTPEQAKQYELESLDELVRRTQELKKSPGLSTVTGPVAGRLPGAAFMTNQDASNAVSTYDKYMEFLQTKGLQDLKARGISPGSITEKEWPKFVARITSLDRVKGAGEVNSELDRMMVDAYNTRAKVSGSGDTFHNVNGKIYRLPAGTDPKRKSSYEEVQ